MVLEEWALIWDLYKSCSATRLVKAVYTPRKIRIYWHLWLASTSYAVSAWVLAFFSGWIAMLGFLLIIVSFWLLYCSVERALATEFGDEYERHAIIKHPFGVRRLYLRYALFLNAIEQEFSNLNLQKLSEFAHIAGKPEPAFRLSQHALVIPFITILTVLSIELIKTTETWQSNNGAVFLLIIGLGLLFVSFMLDIVRSIKQKQIEILRFIEWAKLDVSNKH